MHPVLYYWVLHILNLILGNRIILHRIFSWVCASLIGIIGFTHIRKDFGKKVGILFSFFSMFLPVITVYAGEIRMYTFAMLLVTLMSIYAYRIYKNEEKNQTKNWILFAIFSLSSAYTHYYGLMAAGIVNILMFIHVIGKTWKTKKVYKRNESIHNFSNNTNNTIYSLDSITITTNETSIKRFLDINSISRHNNRILQIPIYRKPRGNRVYTK